MKRNKDWFRVDKDGLAKMLGRQGKAFIAFELLQNAWDEPGVTRCHLFIGPRERGKVWIQCVDDAPEGFSDLSHAYTLFAQSRKRSDPKRATLILLKL